MIAPKKVYIPIAHGAGVWGVAEISTAAARKDRYNWITCNRVTYPGNSVFLTAADARAWVNTFWAYHGPMYTAADIASIKRG